jgi:hypothetical protein
MKLISLRTACAAALLACAGVSAPAAHAASFDGSWSVTITTTRGSCDSGVIFAIQVRGSAVLPTGSVSVHGHVAPSGAVTVHVSDGGSNASGSGRLHGSSGGGSWHGQGSRGTCSGTWSASRG